jgi:hypothetical protein
MEVKVITLTENDLENLLMKAVQKALMIKEGEVKSADDTQLQELRKILVRFPEYNTKKGIEKLREKIKAGEFGKIDRFNRYKTSYKDLYNYLYKKS